MKRIVLLLLCIGCGGFNPLGECLTDCHELAIGRCITSEGACLAQCHAGDYLTVAIQRSSCCP